MLINRVNMVSSQSEATKGSANSVLSFQVELFDLWIMKTKYGQPSQAFDLSS